MSTSSDNRSKVAAEDNSDISTNSSDEFVVHNLADVTSINSDPEKNLGLSRTETKKDLELLGVSSERPPPSITAPPVEDPIFPEEYGLETTTGLVRVKTLESLGRTKSHKSEIKDDTEFVTFTIGDPENPHNWPMAIKWLYTFCFPCWLSALLMDLLVCQVVYLQSMINTVYRQKFPH